MVEEWRSRVSRSRDPWPRRGGWCGGGWYMSRPPTLFLKKDRGTEGPSCDPLWRPRRTGCSEVTKGRPSVGSLLAAGHGTRLFTSSAANQATKEGRSRALGVKPLEGVCWLGVWGVQPLGRSTLGGGAFGAFNLWRVSFLFLVSWFFGFLVFWFLGFLVSWFFGFLVSWFFGFLVAKKRTNKSPHVGGFARQAFYLGAWSIPLILVAPWAAGGLVPPCVVVRLLRLLLRLRRP